MIAVILLAAEPLWPLPILAITVRIFLGDFWSSIACISYVGVLLMLTVSSRLGFAFVFFANPALIYWIFLNTYTEPVAFQYTLGWVLIYLFLGVMWRRKI